MSINGPRRKPLTQRERACVKFEYLCALRDAKRRGLQGVPETTLWIIGSWHHCSPKLVRMIGRGCDVRGAPRQVLYQFREQRA